MDKRSKEMFDEILSLDIEDLTEMQIAFLNARRSYIPHEKLDYYDRILNRVETPKKTPKKQKKEIADTL